MKKNLTEHDEYIVYIISDRNKNTHINISDNGNLTFEDQAERYSKLIYFEKFRDRSEALSKKKYLLKLNEAERIKLVKKKNPEMLNLIFTIYDS